MLKLLTIVFWLPLFLNDIRISLKVIYIFFLLTAFKVFFFVFNSFTMMCLGMGVLYLPHLGYEAILKSSDLRSCKFWENLSNGSPNIASHPFSLS